MQLPRRALLRLAGGALALPAGHFAWAQAYPDKPIRILVGFAPAGPADIAARVLGEKLTASWGKPVVIENVTGAAGNVSAERVAKAAPDGYTLLVGASSTIVTNISLYGKLGFDPVRDFAPISQLCVTPNILALNNDVPVKSVAELVALAKAQPNALTFGSAGVGTSQHLAGELFKVQAGIKLQHVPYRGIAQVVPDLLGGRLTMVFGNISAMLPLARENKVRALAVTSLKRAPSLPDMPTMAEQGFPSFDATAWFGVLAPSGTPAPVIARLHAETAKISGHAGRAQEIRRPWHGDDRQLAGAIRRGHQGRDFGVGEGDQGGRREGDGVRAVVKSAQWVATWSRFQPPQRRNRRLECHIAPAMGRLAEGRQAHGRFPRPVRKNWYCICCGASKPDLSSAEAVKRALVNARAVAIADPAGLGSRCKCATAI